MYYLTSTDQNAAFAPLTINGAPCLATGFEGMELDIITYTSTRARDNDLNGRLDQGRALGFSARPLGTKDPVIIHLRDDRSGDVAVSGTIQTPHASYLVTGTQTTGFSTRAYSHPADRAEAVEERVADLLAQGWHLTT